MKKISVLLDVTIKALVVVDADQRFEAEETAKAVALARLRDFNIGVSAPLPDKVSVIASKSDITTDDAKTETYVCNRCTKASPKLLWGPGRVRCPYCLLISFTVAEMEFLSKLPACTCAFSYLGWNPADFKHLDDCPWRAALLKEGKTFAADGSLINMS